MRYKTYAEAQIANPDSEIVTTTELHSCGPEFEFLPVKFIRGYYRSQCDSKTPNVENGIWVVCNPADYCSSVKEFLEAGFKLDAGDYILGVDDMGYRITCKNSYYNILDEEDCDRYILSAAALNGGCKIPAKAEQWTIYNNTMPLCDLSDEQAAMLFNAWRGGIDMEKNINNKWFKLANLEPCLLPTSVYRIKQKSERELLIGLAEKVIDDSGCFKDDRATAVSVACCLINSGKFKLVRDGE
ncbi:hypothetical protein ZP9_00042 [Shewanella phage ZP9]|nr:hypothetical protein ZP9_00042 [Shewanella phage ZP9]